jgi:coenzyme F420-0:L-glutamate ligase / coenzyme F420-1:gamma-L-glutamate ligase
MTGAVTVVPLPYDGDIAAGADLAAIVLAAAPPLAAGDVVVVAHKAVAKSEGRVVDLREIEPSPRARALAAGVADPRHVEVVLRESVRLVRHRPGLLIAETRHGFVCANAGVDRSNTPGPDHVVLLPLDPDRSAAELRRGIAERAGVEVGVIVADTMGRAFRAGIVGTAIGVAGLAPLRELAGAVDPAGYVLRTSRVAVADEIAAAADLVLGKLERVPAALVRGYAGGGEGSARDLVRDPARDLFR